MGGIRPQRVSLKFTCTGTCLEGKSQFDVRVGSDCSRLNDGRD